MGKASLPTGEAPTPAAVRRLAPWSHTPGFSAVMAAVEYSFDLGHPPEAVVATWGSAHELLGGEINCWEEKEPKADTPNSTGMFEAQ